MRSGCTPEGIVLRVERSCKPQRSERRAAPRRHSPEGDRRIRTGRPRAASRARREAFRACWRGTFRTGRSGGRRGGCVAWAGPSACSCPRRSTCRTGRTSLPRKDSRPSLSLSRESQSHTHLHLHLHHHHGGVLFFNLPLRFCCVFARTTPSSVACGDKVRFFSFSLFVFCPSRSFRVFHFFQLCSALRSPCLLFRWMGCLRNTTKGSDLGYIYVYLVVPGKNSGISRDDRRRGPSPGVESVEERRPLWRGAGCQGVTP